MGLITLDEAKRRCGKRTGDNVDDVVINEMIDAASEIASARSGRSFDGQTYTDYIDGTGGSTVYLDHPPIASVTGIWLDWTGRYQGDALLTAWNETTGAGNYTLNLNTGELRLVDGTRFMRGTRVLKVSYTSSIVVPERIKEGCRELVKHWFTEQKRDPNISSVGLGSYTISYGSFVTGATVEFERICTQFFDPFSVGLVAGY